MMNKMLRAGGGIQTSVIVSVPFYKACKKHNITFSEALRTGIALMLAEQGVVEYDNGLNLHRKMILAKQELAKAVNKLEELKKK